MEYIQWPLQVPKLEVPTIFNGLCEGYVRGYTHTHIYIHINMYIYIYMCDTILVGGLEHEFDFPYIGNVIIPTVTHSIIFQRGRLKPPTRTGFRHVLPKPCKNPSRKTKKK